MSTTRIGRAASALLAVIIVTGALAAPASVRSALDAAKHRRSRLTHAIKQARGRFDGLERRLDRAITRETRQLANAPSRRSPLYGRWRETRRQISQERREALHRSRILHHDATRRLSDLRSRLAAVDAWIGRYGVFQTCPVRGWHVVTNNFGVIVRKPDVPVHVHQGNDITALYGTPIVAPFAGTAVTAANVLGGMAVKVYGANGYVYNAHLSRYGMLGTVKAGDVIGYVGASGDAGGPHDHFEWHPWNGVAVDPYPYLAAVC